MEIEETEERLTKIQNTSEEFVLDVLKTLPFLPFSTSVNTKVKGLPYYKESKKYINDCLKKGIMPYSSLDIIYENNKLNPFASDRPYHFSYINLSKQQKRKVEKARIAGGKFYEINYFSKDHEESNNKLRGLDKFRKDVLENLLKENYVITHFYLRFVSNKYDQTLLGLDFRQEEGLFLQEGAFFNAEEEAPKIHKWFNNLKKKVA